MKTLTELMEWQALRAHQDEIASQRMQDWFDQDALRFERFSLQQSEILLDYSKNRITPKTLHLLNNLAHACELKQKIEDLFSGRPVNTSEKRPALHTALRHPDMQCLLFNNTNIMPAICSMLEKMRAFSNKIRQQLWLGCTGKPIKNIVNIGIGGSHLGPLMTINGLADFAKKDLHCHFISNIDSAHLNSILEKINPETTLFIVSSKSFSTLETITNATTLRHWLINQLGTKDVTAHFIAITAETELAIEFGIPEENIFTLWNWVGGRYSIWSAIGLPLAIMIGMDLFLEFLHGAYEMDHHFQNADFSKNMPVIMGLLGIWYINFFESTHHAVIPYSHHLNYLRMHLQQLDMESNGKNISHHGLAINIRTCPVIFGEQGCNGQHAFHQLLHQGQHLIPVDFILVGKEKNALEHHQDILIGSGLSQSQALMKGKSYAEAFAELKSQGYSESDCAFLAGHKTVPGNRPSNVLFMNRITPRSLGSLLALYEHKTFVQGAIWQINSFDQWGVELGKKLLPAILANLNSITPQNTLSNDSSTQGLIQYYKNLRRQS